VKRIRETVRREFPEMGEVEPSVEWRAAQVGGQEVARYRLAFCKRVELEGGHSMSQRVQVTTDGQGKILKIVSSRG